MDAALLNRALRNIGQAPLAPSDKEADNETWLTAKEYYLAAMLEALAQVEWTGAKRRRELTPAMMPYKGNPDFAYAYTLPLDCAKPVELDGQAYFEVEANLLYADENPARLLYVANGRRLIDQTTLSAGNARRKLTAEYVAGGDAGRNRRYEWGDNVVSGGNAGRPKTVPAPPERNEDFPDYRELQLEPNFYLYWEYLLSYKYALRMTEQRGLADAWFAKAMAIGRQAETVSIAASAGRIKAPDTWQEQLGLN